jgi:hypothetical protein
MYHASHIQFQYQVIKWVSFDIEPMLVSSPMEQQCSHNMEMLENEELTSIYAADIYRHLRQSEVIYITLREVSIIIDRLCINR